MIGAVLFDMDGVLFNTEQMYAGILDTIMREYGYEMDMPFFIGTLGVTNRECRRMYTDAFGEDFPYEDVYRRLFSKAQAHVKAHGMPLKPGVQNCLETLKAQGLSLVLATSCPRFAVENYFADLPALDRLLDGKVCGDDVVRGKPDPEIYLQAAGIAGQPPANCMGVEDSMSGLRAIRAAGAYAVMIPDMLPYSQTLAPYTDSVLHSLAELPALLDTLNGR